MAHLYEINQQLQELMDQWEKSMEYDATNNDGTVSMDFDGKMQQLLGDFNVKVENICQYMRNIETDIDAIDSEIDRLAKQKKTKQSQFDKLKNYLSNNLQQQGVEKMEAGTFKLSFRKSTSLEIVDESKLPDQFKEKIESIKIDKALIKQHISSIDNFDPKTIGCEIITKQNLQIK